MKLFSFLKYISVKKAINLVLLAASFFLTKITGRVIVWGKPVSLTIEPTNRCDLHCPQCERTMIRNADVGEMDMPLYQKIINESSSYLFSLVLHFQGEPLLHPHILEMISLASERDLYTIVSTNGQVLDPDFAMNIVTSGINEVIISMDGLDQSTYEKYRIGGDLNKVKEGIQNLIICKNKRERNIPIITLQFLVFSHNQHQVNEIKTWGRDIGVDRVNIKTARMIDFETGNLMMPEDKFTRYRQVEKGQYNRKGNLTNHCWRSWSRSVITWDGDTLPCCFDMRREHIFGNIKKNSFHEIWKSSGYNSFRKRIIRNRKEIRICCNCTEGIGYSIN